MSEVEESYNLSAAFDAVGQAEHASRIAVGAVVLVVTEVATATEVHELRDHMLAAVGGALRSLGDVTVDITTVDGSAASEGVGVRHSQTDPEQRQSLVGRWTGREIEALQTARRMTIEEVAALVGVTARAVSRWIADGGHPSAKSQRMLDDWLSGASPAERERFVAILSSQPEKGQGDDASPTRARAPAKRTTRRNWKGEEGKQELAAMVANLTADPEMQQALQAQDLTAIFRYLEGQGVSQRRIGDATQLTQSQVSEIVNEQRNRTRSHKVLLRVATGLGIEPGMMGLAYTPATQPDEPSS